MSAPLLRTKLYMPPVRPHLVGRARLVERLNGGLYLPDGAGFARKLTLISAPPGFGKTTLLVEWLAGFRMPDSALTPPPVAWLSLDPDDNALPRFLTYLIAAIEVACPDVGRAAALIDGPQMPGFKAVLTVLINALAQTSTPLPIVLDDYHLIDQPSIHEAMTFLLDHLPPAVHLVIAGRVDPPLPLSRLRARGALLELRAADLRFTNEETAAFLNETMGLSLSAQDVDTLQGRTEGWVSGLQLAALALRAATNTPTDRAQFIAAFGGSHRYIIDYLAEEVLARQPPDLRAFLLHTSVLDRLSAPLCNAVTGRDDSDAVLHHLERANLFLERLDATGEWYRYHRLFADFLRSRLDQELPERIHDLHCRAAEWYEQHGLLAAAIGHALQANESEWAARMMEQIAQPMLLHGEALTLLGWIDRLPFTVQSNRPWLCVYRGWALIVSGRLDEVENCLAQLNALLAGVESPAERADLEQQIDAIRAMSVMYSGDIETSARLARRTLHTLSPRNAFLRTILTWLIGFTSYFDQDITLAQQVFGETLKQSQAEGNTMLILLSLFVSGYLASIQGNLGDAQTLWQRGLQLGQAGEQMQPALDQLGGLSLIYQGLAQVAYERNELALAEQYAARCVELGERWGNAEVLADGYLAHARVQLALGQWDAAGQSFTRAEALVHAGRLAAITARLIAAHRARLWLALGDWVQARRWAKAQRQSDQTDPGGLITLLVRVAEHASLARLALAQADFAQAEAALEAVLPPVREAGWHGVEIELLALRALTLDGQGHQAEAWDAIAQAIRYAQPEGYIRPFLDLGAPMRRLLAAFARQAQAAGEIGAYIGRLLAAFQGPDVPSVELPHPTTLFEPLSDRELEVLRLIADGLTNNEIAEQLTVAVSTVKTHINNLYRKLDVTSRTRAIARARESKLL